MNLHVLKRFSRIRATAAASALVIAAGGAFAPAHAGDSQTYDVDGFTGVAASAAIEMKVEVGGDFSVRAEADKDDGLDRFEVLVKGDTLVAKRKRKNGINIGWNDNANIMVYVTMPSLSSVDTSSAATIVVSGVDGGDVDLDASSGSDIEIAGTCDRVTVDASSGADIDARDLECKEGQADASSGADIYLYASEEFRGDASSGADIVVYGSPSIVDADSSSGGDVTVRR